MNKQYWKNYFENKANNEHDIYKRVGFVSARNTERVRNHVRQFLGQPVKEMILDAGCGDGLVTTKLSEKNQVIGFDFSKNMLTIAQQNGLYAVCGDLEKMPFKQEAFDKIVTIEAVTLLDDPYQSLGQMASFVKKGGVMVISALNNRSILRQFAEYIYRSILRRAIPGKLDLKKIETTLAEKNVSITDIIFIYCLPFFSFESRAGRFIGLKLLFANNMIIKAKK